MKKFKKNIAMFLVGIMAMSLAYTGVFASESLNINYTQDEGIIDSYSENMFWTEQESPNCKFYAEIDGVVQECSREEYVKYGIKHTFSIDGKNVTLNNEEYQLYVEKNELPQKIKEQLLNSNYDSTAIMSSVMPTALTRMAKWNFTSLAYPNYVDTSFFDYEAANSNRRVTLNLRQWRSSGSTNEAELRYQVLQLNSNGYITAYIGEDYVTEYVPNDSNTDPYQIRFDMPSDEVNNLIVRVTSMDDYYVSGFGEIYNY